LTISNSANDNVLTDFRLEHKLAKLHLYFS
jgi:hypothetical protein